MVKVSYQDDAYYNYRMHFGYSMPEWEFIGTVSREIVYPWDRRCFFSVILILFNSSGCNFLSLSLKSSLMAYSRGLLYEVYSIG